MWCQCKDRLAKRECLEWGNGKIWDSVKCECICPNTQKCTHGKFNINDCKCDKILTQSFESTLFVQRVARSDILANSWQCIVIIILSCFLVILFLVITSLLCRIRSLMAAIKDVKNVPYFTPQSLFDKAPELPPKAHSTISNSDISSCPKCPTESSVCTDSLVSEIRSTPSQIVYSQTEWCSLLPKETNI